MADEPPKTGLTPCVLGVFTEDCLRLDGLKLLLESDGRFQVEALVESERLMELQVSVVLLDVGSAAYRTSLLGHFRRVRPLLPVLVMGPPADMEGTMQLLQQGARGYLNHSVSEAELRLALQVVLEGSIWAPRKVLSRLLTDAQQSKTRPPALTPREREVLDLLVGGRSNRASADALSLDEATVKAHLGRLMRKLGVDNRIGLSMYVLERARHARHASIDKEVTFDGDESL